MVKFIKWIGVSESFKRLKHFVSPYETLCFITWNTLFQGMKQSVSTVETDIEIRNSSFKSVQKETKKIVNSPIYTAERLATLKETPYI